MTRRFLISLILISIAAPAYAGVAITEIMYDLEGADTGREWIEIQNTGSSPADLTGWKFFEANTNHGLTLIQGDIALQSNSFAIIADNAEKFLIDWPGFSGALFDSSFSFSNTGETLTLRDAELVDNDTVTYSSDWGANGDGKSLQKIGSEWVVAPPTPESTPPPEEESNEAEASASEAQISGSVAPRPVAQIKAYAGEDRSAIAGATIFFDGFAEGIAGEPLDGARFSWNFGDGSPILDGKKVGHVFLYPGAYAVSLNVSSGEYSAIDTANIAVTASPLLISEIKSGPDGWIEIKNNSARKIEISRFGISYGDRIFTFSENTFMAPYAALVLGTTTLGFSLPAYGGEIKFIYPNGSVMSSLSYPALALAKGESLNFNNGVWVVIAATPGAKNEIVKKTAAAVAATKSAEKSADEPQKSAPQTASVINIESPGSALAFLGGDYFWLFAGIGAGAVAALVFFLGKR